MKRMPNKRLRITQVNWLITHRLFSSGGEAIVCRTKNPNTLYKIFTKASKPITMCDNKKEKILKLHQMSLENSVHPLRTLSCNGELIGYEMTYDPRNERFTPYDLSQEEMVHFLEESKKILEAFAQKDITYGDVADRNVLVNRKTGQVTFCDMDNIRLGENPIDLISIDLREYEDRRGIDAQVDAYMHSLFTLHAFDLDEQETDMDYFIDIFDSPIERIIPTLREPENFQGEYIVEYIKKKK